MASLTVIQYTQNVPQSTPDLPKKPWWTDTGKEAAKMQPISRAAANSGWQTEPAEESNHVTQIVPSARSNANGAQDQVIPDYDSQLMKRFRERFGRNKTRVEARMRPSDFGHALDINTTAPVLPDTLFPGRNTEDFDSVQFETGEDEQAHVLGSSPVLNCTEFAMESLHGCQNNTNISGVVTETKAPNKLPLFAENELKEIAGDGIQDPNGLAPGQHADYPVLIEDSTIEDTSIIEDSSENGNWEAGMVAGREDNTNESTPAMLSEAVHVDHDMDNLMPARNNPLVKDPSESPLQEPEIPHNSPKPPHTATPPYAGPAKEQEDSLDPVEERNIDTIVVESAVSDREGSSDDSEDEDYVEEKPLPAAKRRRVRYDSGERQLSMSPADTFNNETQGSPSDVADMSEEIPVCGSLKLREVDGKVMYYLTFSQGLLTQFLDPKQSVTSNTPRSPRNKSTTSSLAQRRGEGVRSRYKFEKEDDDKIIQMREEEKSWDEISREFPGSTKGSIQVRYSTKLKDRKVTPKRVYKDRHVK